MMLSELLHTASFMISNTKVVTLSFKLKNTRHIVLSSILCVISTLIAKCVLSLSTLVSPQNAFCGKKDDEFTFMFAFITPMTVFYM